MIASSAELLYFIELAKTLNFSRAAERIGISQPSLSAAIKRLEQSLGVALFVRDKHSVSLTHAGKRFLLHAMELQQLWYNTKSVCLAVHEEVQGNVVLGCHPSVAMYSLHHFLPELLKKYPDLEIQLKHDLSRKIVEEIISLKIDVGIVVNPIKNPNLVIKKLFEDEFAFWQSTKNPNSSPSKETIIICDLDLLQTQYLLKRLHNIGVTQHRIVTTSNLEVITRLTAEGVGIGILPGLVAGSIAPDMLKKIPKTPTYRDEVCLVYRHENRNVKAIQVLSEAIKSLMSKI